MKKIFIIILISIIALLSLEVYISFNRNSEEKLYILPQAYGYKYADDRRLVINVYTNKKNSMLQYQEENQYIISGENLYYTLENVNVKMIKQNEMYQMKISADLPEVECDLDSFEFIAINEAYKVAFNAGSLYISQMKDYELLSIKKYYPSYGYVNGSLHLLGLNIELFNIYETLSELTVNSYARGTLNQALVNVELENEIDIKKYIPSYDVNVVSYDSLALKSNKYFIPLGYQNIKFIKEGITTLELDSKRYYIDNIPFMANDINYYDYVELMILGEVEYAEA